MHFSTQYLGGKADAGLAPPPPPLAANENRDA